MRGRPSVRPEAVGEQGDMFGVDSPPRPPSPEETFSYSRLGTFRNCKANYKYRYVDKLPSEDEGIEAFMGKQVHAALEFLYGEVKRGALPDIVDVLSVYEKRWAEEDSPRVVVVKRGMVKNDFLAKGRSLLEGYFRSHHPFQAGEIVLLEGRLAFDLAPEGGVKFQAILDRLMRGEDGALEVHDYKTGKRLPTQEQVDEDGQLALYEIAVRKHFGHEGPVRLVWHYLAHGKALQSSRSPEALALVQGDLLGRVEEVRKAKENGTFPPAPGPLCYYCSYKKKCREDYKARGEHHPVLDG